MHPSNPKAPSNTLEKLLARGDVWRGCGADAAPQANARFLNVAAGPKPEQQKQQEQQAVATGYSLLDEHLRANGWPNRGMVDIALPNSGPEWLLLLPAIKQLMGQGQRIAMINPPWLPYAMALAKAGIDLNQLLIVSPQTLADWVAVWRELCTSGVCGALLAWAPNKGLSYTALRKCQLVATEYAGLHCVFRHWHSQAQSSPAVLRLSLRWQTAQLQCHIVKQKGLVAGQMLALTIPPSVQALQPFLSSHTTHTQTPSSAKPASAQVIPLWGQT